MKIIPGMIICIFISVNVTFSEASDSIAGSVRKLNGTASIIRYEKKLPAEEENMDGIDISSIDMVRVARQLQNIKKKCAGTALRIYQHPDLSFDDAQRYYKYPTRFVFYDTCKAPWRNVSVTPKGNIILSPLCFLPALGNVKKESFAAIWNGVQFKKLRADLKKVKAYPACTRCCLLFDSKTKYYKIASMIR